MEILTDKEYQKISEFIYNKLGIDVDDKKRDTVSTKISKLVTRNKMASPSDYVKALLSSYDGEFIQEFFNEITTNTTEFFRENQHFEFLKAKYQSLIDSVARIKINREIRVWSAPCSSGEEPISIAITLKECLPDGYKIKILATDVSEKILAKAERGIYSENECKGVPPQYLKKYFTRQQDGFYKINDIIKNCITYRLFNLMDDFKFNKGFDIIFCRNVMIYFDSEVQQSLIDRFYNQLEPNGYFLIGHSESLLNKKHKFTFLANATFKK